MSHVADLLVDPVVVFRAEMVEPGRKRMRRVNLIVAVKRFEHREIESLRRWPRSRQDVADNIERMIRLDESRGRQVNAAVY